MFSKTYSKLAIVFAGLILIRFLLYQLSSTNSLYSSKHLLNKSPRDEEAAERVFLEDSSSPGINFSNASLTRNITEKELTNRLLKNCDADFTNFFIQLDEKNLLPFPEYKKHLAYKFVKAYGNPVKKSEIRPTLQSYENIPRPDPKKRIKDVNLIVDNQAIDKEIQKEKERRLKLGDDDILKIPEVQAELAQSEYKVPNLIHYIWFGCSRFRVDHFITEHLDWLTLRLFDALWAFTPPVFLLRILGGLKIQKPRLILFHTDCEPSREYWDVLKMISGSKLKVIRRSQPLDVWGLKSKVVEHKADIARLQILLEVGGIYLDTDSVVLRPLDGFRRHEMVLSESSFQSLANNMVFANRSSWFLKRWYMEYQHFDDSQWGFNSVLVPWAMWQIYPNTIHVVKKLMCRPNWSEVNYIYLQLYDWHQNYIIHLYSRYMKQYDGTMERPLKQLAVLNTTYGQIARYVIWGDEKIRDVTDWVITCNLTKLVL